MSRLVTLLSCFSRTSSGSIESVSDVDMFCNEG